MSFSPCPDPTLGDRGSADAVEPLIVPRSAELGEENRHALLRAEGAVHSQ